MSNNETVREAREHDMSDTGAEVVVQVAEPATDYGKIGQGVVTGYKKIEAGVVTGYKKVEDGVVKGFGKVVDKCVEVLFAREGESVEDAKARLSGKDKA